MLWSFLLNFYIYIHRLLLPTAWGKEVPFCTGLQCMKLYLVKVLRINGHWVISPNWDIYIVPPSKAQGIGLKRRWKEYPEDREDLPWITTTQRLLSNWNQEHTTAKNTCTRQCLKYPIMNRGESWRPTLPKELLTANYCYRRGNHFI